MVKREASSSESVEIKEESELETTWFSLDGWEIERNESDKEWDIDSEENWEEIPGVCHLPTDFSFLVIPGGE